MNFLILIFVLLLFNIIYMLFIIQNIIFVKMNKALSFTIKYRKSR